MQQTFTRIVFLRAKTTLLKPGETLMPCYRDRLKALQLKTLFHRRIINDLLFSFRLYRLELKLRPSKYWTFIPTHGRRSEFSVRSKLTSIKVNTAAHFVFHRTVGWLQKLPIHVLNVNNSLQFKNKIKNIDLLQILGINDL